MSTTAVAIRPGQEIATSQRLTDVQRLGNILAASGYFADAREMAQAAVKVMAGEELGIPPVAAMMGINIIKGKVALSGNLIASRIRAHGYDYRHKQFDNTGCVLVFFGRPGADGKREVLGESSFNAVDAEAAGLKGNDNYKKFPRNMYFNRAISNGAKWYCPEIFTGLPVYVAEELGAKVDENGDAVIEESPKPTPAEVAQSKITQMQAGKDYREVSGTPDPKVAGPSPESSGKPWRGKKQMIECFQSLKAQLGPYTGVYYEQLKNYLRADGKPVAHANEFANGDDALAAYRAIESLVAQYKDMLAEAERKNAETGEADMFREPEA